MDFTHAGLPTAAGDGRLVIQGLCQQDGREFATTKAETPEESAPSSEPNRLGWTAYEHDRHIGAMNVPTDLFVIGTREGFAPRVGVLVSQLQNARHYLLRAVRDLPAQALDAAESMFQPSNA